jgi:hypothetical protein
VGLLCFRAIFRGPRGPRFLDRVVYLQTRLEIQQLAHGSSEPHFIFLLLQLSQERYEVDDRETAGVAMTELGWLSVEKKAQFKRE